MNKKKPDVQGNVIHAFNGIIKFEGPECNNPITGNNHVEIDARVNYQIGSIKRHFKRDTLSKEEKIGNGHLYRVIAFATDTETRNRLMIYQALYGSFATFAKPLDMCRDEVDKEKYPYAKQKYRLEVIHYMTHDEEGI
jgi:hypothetical protein